MKTYFILFLFIVCSSFAISQNNYIAVDKVVATYPSSFQSVEEFAHRIEKDFTKDADKVRAAYYWIAHHIQYNYKILGTDQTGYPTITINDYRDESDYRYKYKKVYASYALQYKAAVCEGYSQLLFYVCEELGIKATVVKGNATTSSHRPGVIPKNTNHAWNAVFFNDTWNLIDVTWSTGNERDKPTHVNFKDTYFCIAPEKMILNHFPKDSRWQLLKTKMSKKTFFSQPTVYSPYLSIDIALNKKIKGLIKGKINDFITL
ncbi:transglutaminase domain-containing protein [Kordia sp.]|uniref:transglutaminase domain-containing protein n=1 Tax=Kordia sp. TaxID=1965332 RepID=UPI003D6B90AD